MKSAVTGKIRICNIGSPGRKICVRPSAGDLKTTNEIIGHHSVRSSAGTAIGTVSVSIGVKSRMRLRPHRPVLADFQIEQKLIGVEILAEAAKRRPHDVAVVRRRPEVAVED